MLLANFKNKDWLYQKYIEEKFTLTEIARICKVSNGSIIRHWLKKFNIPMRTQSEAQQLWHKEDSKMRKSYHKNRDLLNYLYHSRKLTMREIAQMCEVSRQTILKWMRRLGTQTRAESRHVERTRIKLRESHLGKPLTEETKEKISKACKAYRDRNPLSLPVRLSRHHEI